MLDLKLLSFKKAFISVPIISLFFSSIKIWEKLNTLFFSSISLIFPVDLKKFLLVEYSKPSKKMLLFSKSLIVTGSFDFKKLFLLSKIILLPERENPSEVRIVVLPILFNIFELLSYSAWSAFKTFFLASVATTPFLKIVNFLFLSI